MDHLHTSVGYNMKLHIVIKQLNILENTLFYQVISYALMCILGINIKWVNFDTIFLKL